MAEKETADKLSLDNLVAQTEASKATGGAIAHMRCPAVAGEHDEGQASEGCCGFPARRRSVEGLEAGLPDLLYNTQTAVEEMKVKKSAMMGLRQTKRRP